MKKFISVIVVFLVSFTVTFAQVMTLEEDESNEWSVDTVNGKIVNSLFTLDATNDELGSVVIETTVSNLAVATVRFDQYDFKFLLPESGLLDSGYLSEEELQYPAVSVLADALAYGLDLMVRARQEIAVLIREMQRGGAVGETVVKKAININKTTVIQEIRWDDSPVALKLLFDINGSSNTSKLILNVEVGANDALFIELDSISINALHEILTVGASNQYTIMRAMLDQIESR